MCYYLMPDGVQANLSDFAGGAGEGTGFQVFPSPGHMYDRSDIHTVYIANFDAVGAPANTYGFAWPQSETVAAECALWMCVQAFETKQVNADQTQNIVSTFSDVVNSSATFSDYVSNTTFYTVPDEMNARPDAIFTAWNAALWAFQDYLTPLFNGSITLNEEEDHPDNDMVQAVWNSSADLDFWIKNVAASMTNVIRTTTPAPEDDMYIGTGYNLGYYVRWTWVILTGFIVAASLFLLLAVMIETGRSPVSAWKGSPLAMLFMDVDPALRRGAVGQMGNFKGVEKTIGKSPVVVGGDHADNWALKTA